VGSYFIRIPTAGANAWAKEKEHMPKQRNRIYEKRHPQYVGQENIFVCHFPAIHFASATDGGQSD
jgi:hypothetical protein